MKRLDNISGILFDLEGVLFVGDTPVEGAIETIRYLKDKQFPHYFVTNTTTKPREALASKMQKLGFEVSSEEILTAVSAASVYLSNKNPASCYPVVADDVKDEFKAIPVSEHNPDVVIIGDIGPAWDYELVNKIFRMLMSGSELIALHKSKYWQTPQGLQIDIGAFIAGLEYASCTKAKVLGKPSPAFFEAGIQALGFPKDQIVMIGDDIESDIGGAQNSGIRGVLVKTGKFRQATLETSSVTPDAILDSVADLPNFL